MNFIGNVIKEYRGIIEMSRKELSENICSEKYVYLIEKGERTPSAELTKLFGDKMGVDLFKYFEYLDCLNPIGVEAAINSFNKYRKKNDMDELQKETEKALVLPDFKRKPWIFEIQINKLAYMTLKERRCREAIDELQNILHDVEPKYSNNICISKFYILLSTCYQMMMDLDNAKHAVLAATKIVANKHNVAQFAHDVIAVKINNLTFHYLSEEFDKVIEEGIALNEYQRDTSAYELCHHGFFYLAYAYYQKGMEEEGISWFLKALYTSLIRYKPMDIYYLSKYEMFQVLSRDKRIPIELVSKFKLKYAIEE